MAENLNIAICGLSLSSSWGNGHATTYRHLVRGLSERGHRVVFLERDVPWYAENRDFVTSPHADLQFYSSVQDLADRFGHEIRQADLVIVGSYVPDGIEVGQWVLAQTSGVAAFYDIDTPLTLEMLATHQCSYLSASQIAQYDLYLSFTGGPVLEQLQRQYGSPCARPLYCSVDHDAYYPEETEGRYDLGYMGTYSADRQPTLSQLLIEPANAWPAGRFVVAGPQYPQDLSWPDNVERRQHVPPHEHRTFYNQQRFTLNVTRAAMRRVGYSPSIRLFEAAACATAVISDAWPGLDEILRPGVEVLVADTAQQSLRYLRELDERQRCALGRRAQQRVLACHTGAHRAEQLEQYMDLVGVKKSASGRA